MPQKRACLRPLECLLECLKSLRWCSAWCMALQARHGRARRPAGGNNVCVCRCCGFAPAGARVPGAPPGVHTGDPP